MKRLSIDINDKTAQLLKLLSIIENRSMSDIIREAIEEKIEKSDVEKKAKMLM